MPKRDNAAFLRSATAGYAAVILLLGGALIVAVLRLDTVAANKLAAIRAEEAKITAAHRLRWSGELLVSVGRGYLVSGEPGLLARREEVAAEFNSNLEELKARSLSPTGESLVVEIEQAARAFERRQGELLATRAGPHDRGQLTARFERELQPLRGALARTLEHLVEMKQERLNAVYAQAEAERAQLMSWTWILTGALTVLVLGIAWYFTRGLTRAYRAEQQALLQARRALAARDEVVNVVAHDLRSPLGTITMKASAIGAFGESDRTRKQAESIANIAMRMEYLIKSLLDAASIEAGRFVVRPGPVVVGSVLDEAMDMFGGTAAAKSVHLHKVGRAGPPGRVGRSRAHAAGPVEPDWQRSQVHSSRRPHHHFGRAGGRRGPLRGGGHRLGHCRGGPAPRVRPLLDSGQGGKQGDRARTVHRERHRRRPRRANLGEQHTWPGHDLLLQAACGRRGLVQPCGVGIR
jgi:signal transduction histidine kinase